MLRPSEAIISVIIPVYNGGNFLRLAVQSLLGEKGPVEIVVVDDASTDESMATITDLPVRILRSVSHVGIARALNVGLASATGEWITFLDSDDLLIGGSIDWRREWLERNRDCACLAGIPEAIINEDGDGIGTYSAWIDPQLTLPPSRVTRKHLELGGVFPGLLWLFMFHRTLLDRIGPFDETLRYAFDNDYILRALSHGEIHCVPRPVVSHRLHSRNHSGVFDGTSYRLHRRSVAEGLWVHLSHGRKWARKEAP